jgi:hypothetical protein
MGEKKPKPCADENLSLTISASYVYSTHTVCPRMSNKCNFPAMYSDKKVSPAKDTGDQSQRRFFGHLGVYHTARMSAWEASEAVVEDMAIRLVAYRYSGKAKGRINRPRVWLATINNVCEGRANGSTMQYKLKCSGITWTWTPNRDFDSLRKNTSKSK